jgi:hypothetical protein
MAKQRRQHGSRRLWIEAILARINDFSDRGNPDKSEEFIHENIPNMATWAEIHAQFAEIDQRSHPIAPTFRKRIDRTRTTHNLTSG